MKDNKIIAEFMGVDKHYEAQSSNMFNQYHTSWDWLMPVANEIIKSRDEQNSDWDLTDLKYALQTTNIELVHQSVVEFIKNQNN